MNLLKHRILLFVTLNNEPNLEIIQDYNCRLNDIVDLYGNNNGLRNIRSNDLLNEHSYDPNRTMSKQFLTFCMPKLDIRSNNYDPKNAIQYGIQFIGMNFQNMDKHLNRYNYFFDNDGQNRPFIKKTDDMIEFTLL